MLPLFLLACAQGSALPLLPPPTLTRLVIWWVMETFAGFRTRASVYGHFVVLLPSAARKLCPIKVEVCASVSVSVAASNCSRKRLMANGNYNLRQRVAKDSSAASWATCRSSTQVSIRCTSLCLYGENLPAHMFPTLSSCLSSLLPLSLKSLSASGSASASTLCLARSLKCGWRHDEATCRVPPSAICKRCQTCHVGVAGAIHIELVSCLCLGLFNLLNYSNADTVAYE